MEFNIRKNATLPYLEVNLLKDGKSDYNYLYTDFSNNNIYFYMKDVDTNFYKVAKGQCDFSTENKSIYFQFNKKNTSTTGRYEGSFKISNNQGEVELPLREKIFINILDSISNSDFCCGTKSNIKPSAVGIYYGKVNKTDINNSDVSSLTFLETPKAINFHITQPEGEGYGYILVPDTMTQPNGFRDSNSGCFGNNVPTNNIGTINIYDTNGVLITYNVYRTFFSFNGQVNIWLCN